MLFVFPSMKPSPDPCYCAPSCPGSCLAASASFSVSNVGSLRWQPLLAHLHTYAIIIIILCSQMTKPSQSFHVSVGEALTLRLEYFVNKLILKMQEQPLLFQHDFIYQLVDSDLKYFAKRCGMQGITGADIHWYKVY